MSISLVGSFCRLLRRDISVHGAALFSFKTCACTSISPSPYLRFSLSVSSLRLNCVTANSPSHLKEQTEESNGDEYDDEGEIDNWLSNALLENEQERGFEDVFVKSDEDSDKEEYLESSEAEKRKKSGNKLMKPPSLTVKEKKELCSYAHGLGKKLKCQLVGKSGVTDTVVASFVETLEKNELLKIKIHGTCPGELEDVVKQLEEATGSIVVGQIGRTVIVYRPSVSKLQAEGKRKQARKLFMRRASLSKAVPREKEASGIGGRKKVGRRPSATLRRGGRGV